LMRLTGPGGNVMATARRLLSRAELPSRAAAITRRGGGLVISVPPGDPRQWPGYTFGIALCVGAPLLGAVIWTLIHFRAGQPAPPGLGLAVPLTVLTCTVGFAFGVGCVMFGRRLAGQQGTIAVRDRHLWVDMTGVWGPVRKHWPVEQIEVIQAAGGDWSSNQRPVMQLQIRPKGGPVVRLLTGRQEPLLRRIADALREELRLPSGGQR